MARREPEQAQSKGDALVADIRAEMDADGCEPTATEEALLRLAHELADRIDVLERIVAADGVMLTSSTGVVRMHPGAVEHRQLALALARVLGGIVIGDSSTEGKNPVKQRAARARWDRLRESQERRRGSVPDGPA